MIASRLNNLSRYAGTIGKVGNQTRPGWGTASGVGAKPTAQSVSAAASGTAGTGQPSDPGTMPWDANYDRIVGNVTTGLNNTGAASVNDENALGLDYGVQFDRNPDGTLSNYRLDPTNPFSKAALLQRAFQQRQSGNTNSYAARGLHNDGSFQNAQDATTFDNQQAGDSLLKGFGSGIRDIAARRQQAVTDAGSQVGQAGWDRLMAAAASTPAPAPADPMNANSMLTTAAGGNLGDLKLTSKGLFRRNPFTGAYDIPVNP